MYIKKGLNVVNTDNVFTFTIDNSDSGVCAIKFYGNGDKYQQTALYYPSFEEAQQSYNRIWTALFHQQSSLDLDYEEK